MGKIIFIAILFIIGLGSIMFGIYCLIDSVGESGNYVFRAIINMISGCCSIGLACVFINKIRKKKW